MTLERLWATSMVLLLFLTPTSVLREMHRCARRVTFVQLALPAQECIHVVGAPSTAHVDLLFEQQFRWDTTRSQWVLGVQRTVPARWSVHEDRTALVVSRSPVQLASTARLLVFRPLNALVLARQDTGARLVRGIGRRSELFLLL